MIFLIISGHLFASLLMIVCFIGILNPPLIARFCKMTCNLLHCVALIRSTSVTNQILLSNKLKVGQIERGVFQEETSARNAKNTLLIAQSH